jgi:hypothetical protein
MKKTLTLLLLMVSLTMANAIIIDLGTAWGSPSDALSELARLNSKTELYDLANDPDLFNPSGYIATQTQVEGDVTSLSLNLSGYQGFLLLKAGPIDRFYYINDELDLNNYVPSVSANNGVYTFTSDVWYSSTPYRTGRQEPTAFSHYTTFTPNVNVADGDAWFICFGMLLPIVFARFSRQTTKA